MGYDFEAMRKDGFTDEDISEAIGYDYRQMVKDGLTDAEISMAIDTNGMTEARGREDIISNPTIEDVGSIKSEIARDEREVRLNTFKSMPDSTPEERVAKNKFLLNEIEPIVYTGESGVTTGAQLETGLRSAARPFVGAAMAAEDVVGKTDFIGEFNAANEKAIKEINDKLGSEAASIVGQILGEIGAVAVTKGAGRGTSLTRTALTEGAAAGSGEYAASEGDVRSSLKSALLASTITAGAGKILGRSGLSEEVAKKIETADPEELNAIKEMYQFASDNNIKVVDALIEADPKKIVDKLRSAGASESMINYAKKMQTETGKDLLKAFNKVMGDAIPDDIKDIELVNIAKDFQKQSKAVKKSMTEEKDAAYKLVDEMPEGTTIKVPAKDIHNEGMNVLANMNADSSLINAYKRIALKNTKLLSKEDADVLSMIKRRESSIADLEVNISAAEASGVDTKIIDKMEDQLLQKYTQLDDLTNKLTLSGINELSLKDISNMVKDLNELKYSGNKHVSTKSPKEQKALNDLDAMLKSQIEAKSPKYSEASEFASKKARDVYELFGSSFRGAEDFPELEKVRYSKNPADVVKTIFKTDALESGHKLEKTLKVLGERDSKFKKTVISKYINDTVGGFSSLEKGKGSLKTTVLDLDNADKGIGKLLDNVDASRLTKEVIGEDRFETLNTLRSFIKHHKETIEAMDIPKDRQGTGVLATPVIKQVVDVANNIVYAIRNIVSKDVFHSTKALKRVNKHINRTLKEYQGSAKTKAAMNKLLYATSGGVIEKMLQD